MKKYENLRVFWFFVLITGLMIAASSPAPGVTVQILPSDDAFIDQNHPDTNYGSSTQLRTGDHNGYMGYKTTLSFLRFPLGSIPSGASITNAELWMYLYECYPSFQNANIYVYWYTDPFWSENTITYNNLSGTLNGPDATLLHYCGGTGWLYWNVTAVVQWLYVGGADYDAAVRMDLDTGFRNFSSKEQAPLPDYRPFLEVTYTLPAQCEPTPDGQACKTFQCPVATEICLPDVINYDPTTGQSIILDCKCVEPNYCHIAPLAGAVPDCVGGCPPGQSCEKMVVSKPDGTEDIWCECIDMNEPITKYIQQPDTTPMGMDIRIDRNDGIQRVIADDFPCQQSGPITDVHFWGSWNDDQKGRIQKIHLSIHKDIPADQSPTGYSMPGTLLWERDFIQGEFVETLYAEVTSYEWWYDPFITPCVVHPQGDTQIWRYDIYIDPNDAFNQTGSPNEPPVIYWLDIWVELEPTAYGQFGWKTRDLYDGHFMDDAVYNRGNGWEELIYPAVGWCYPGSPGHPYAGDSIDMAFAITTTPEGNEPNEPPLKPAVPHLKWSQPPIEIEPTNRVPVYCGWDEETWMYETAGMEYKVVADDFRCVGEMPITSIHWWGSFWDYQGQVLPAILPDAWQFTFYTNVPANNSQTYFSRPEMVVKSFVIPANRVEVQWVGYDSFPDMPGDTCWQWFVKLYETEYFRQRDFTGMTDDEIYWISITPIYSMPPYDPYGWKTRPEHWMDDAVTFYLPEPPVEGMIVDPLTTGMHPIEAQGQSFDVSFEFDTDPNYIKWEQAYDGFRRWAHYEDEPSMAIDDGTGVEPQIIRLVADDWQCIRKTSVTAIVWWGSYLGYRYETPCETQIVAPPVKPDYFLLSIWTDVPVGPGNPYLYSHPGTKMWEYRAYSYDEVMVGYDKYPEALGQPVPGPREAVYRYSVRLPQGHRFLQKNPNGIYWLSVVAVYSDVPQYEWGWTNHPHFFNDDAVAGIPGAVEPWIWEELYDQTGASEDMSFVLFTGGPICWDASHCPGQPIGDATCDGTVNALDMLRLKLSWMKCYGDPAYNCCADFDQNGCVNALDMLRLKLNWLKTGLGGDGTITCP
ncbi:MAG: DNRLRE domain-containing protein [Planctomycetota bacterium]